MSFSLLCAFYWHLVRQTETGYSNFTFALSVAKQGRALLLFYSTPILAGFKAIFIFGDAALLPFISRETISFFCWGKGNWVKKATFSAGMAGWTYLLHLNQQRIVITVPVNGDDGLGMTAGSAFVP